MTSVVITKLNKAYDQTGPQLLWKNEITAYNLTDFHVELNGPQYPEGFLLNPRGNLDS